MSCFFPFFIVLLGIGLYLLTSYHKSENVANPELINTKNQQLFIYESGTAINFHKIEKFRVSNPAPYKYEVNAYIGWTCYTIKSGFDKKEDAEQWLINFLKETK